MAQKLTIPLLMYKESGNKKKGIKKGYVVPTVNHIYNTRRMMTPWASAHREKLRVIAENWVKENNWQKTKKKKVVLKFYFYYHDNRKRDSHNMLKLILDAFNDVIYDDDYYALPQIIDFEIDRKNPRIEVEIMRKC